MYTSITQSTSPREKLQISEEDEEVEAIMSTVGLASTAGTHRVCVCIIHQNVDILLSVIGLKKPSTKEFFKVMVCDTDDRDCMLNICKNCPDTNTVLRQHI
jgi:hypothetical protein